MSNFGTEEPSSRDEVVEYSAETIEEANKLKDKGNSYLAVHKYALAAESYCAAIDMYPLSAIFFANRAQAFIKLESYGLAISDANSAIK